MRQFLETRFVDLRNTEGFIGFGNHTGLYKRQLNIFAFGLFGEV